MENEKLPEEIISEARAEADEIKRKAKAEALNILLQGRTESEAIRREVWERTEKEKRREEKSLVAVEKASFRKELSEIEERILHEAFNGAEKKLEDFRKGKEYPVFLKECFEAAKETISGKPSKVLCREDDVRIVKSFSGDLNIESVRMKGGLVLENDSERIDLSFESALEQVRKENGVELRRVVFG